MADDNTITEEIRAGYIRDDRIPHPAEIAVSVQTDTVTLRGTLASPHQIRAAVDIAETTRGVRQVASELSLDPRDRWEDGEIRGRALQALISNDNVPAEHVDVHVADGWLTIKGGVKHQTENDAAFAAVSKLQGVGGITNEIKVISAGLR
jgi:osmotically-inducible protein OsmY